MGTTSEWFTTVAKVAEAMGEHWPTLEAFWKALEGRFGDANPELTVWAQLTRIQKGTHLVHMYSNKFNKILIKTRFNEQALVDCYYEGLNWKIMWCIFMCDEIPSDLLAAQAIASRIEDQEAQFQRFNGPENQQQRGQCPGVVAELRAGREPQEVCLLLLSWPSTPPIPGRLKWQHKVPWTLNVQDVKVSVLFVDSDLCWDICAWLKHRPEWSTKKEGEVPVRVCLNEINTQQLLISLMKIEEHWHSQSLNHKSLEFFWLEWWTHWMS